MKYHEGWGAVVSAGCVITVLFSLPRPWTIKLRIFRGILVPGGFGVRGTEGMIQAIQWAREHKVPYLGICLGFQLAVIEWARNVCKIKGSLLLLYFFVLMLTPR